MKIYTQTFDLAKASPHRFWVAPFSEFKIGIKILEKDEISEKDFTLKAGSIEFTPDEDKIDNFTLYTIKSNDTGFVEYTIEVEGVAEKLKLMQIVTDSTVFEIDAGGGGDVPADVATQTWVNSQISDFITDDALTACVPLSGNVNMTGSLSVANDSNGVQLDSSNGVTVWDIDEGKRKAISLDYDGLFVKDYDDTAAKEIEYPTKSGTMVVDADLTAYYTKSETEQVAVLKQAPSKATVVKYADGTLSSLNLKGSLNWDSIPNRESVVEACFGTDVTEIGQQTLYQAAKLTSVVIPDTVKKIGPSAFSTTALCGELSLPEGLEDVAGSAFSGTQINVLHLPSTIKRVGLQAFGMNNYRGNYLSSIIIEPGATGFQTNAFGLVSADVMFKGKTLAEVQAMENYPWGLEQTNRISAELTPTQTWTQANFAANLSGVAGIMKISQADYDALSAGGTADANTLYVIV